MEQKEYSDSDLESILKEFSADVPAEPSNPEAAPEPERPTPAAPVTEEIRLPEPEEIPEPPMNREPEPRRSMPQEPKTEAAQEIPAESAPRKKRGAVLTEPVVPLTEAEFIAHTDAKFAEQERMQAELEAEAADYQDEPEQSGYDYPENVIPSGEGGKKRSRKKKEDEYGEDRPKKKWIAPLVIILVLLGGAFFGVRYAAIKVSEMDTIFPNVYLDTTPLGGLTREQAEETLRQCNWEKMVSGDLEVRLPMNVNAYVNYVDAGVRMSQEEAIEAAMAYGRSDTDKYKMLYAYVNAMILTTNVVDRAIVIDGDYVRQQLEAGIAEFDKVSGDNAYEMDLENAKFYMLKGAGEVKIDEELLYTKVETALRSGEESITYRVESDYALTAPDFEKIHEEERAEAQDAYYDRDKDEIIDEVVGLEFDPKTALKIWEAAEPLTMIEVPLNTTPAEITAKDLKEILFRDVLGEYTTSFKGSTDNRCSNINIAVDTINGTVLLPGETFSYNTALGERTEDKGYTTAAAYDNGEVVQALGGGICQVSSTLCCAVRLSLLDYTRTNHQFQVSYIDAGLDATVDYTNFENGGGVDFTFTNNKTQPIKIVGFCDNDTKEVTFQILGTDYDHYTVEFKNKFICYLTHAEAFPNDTNHTDEYNNTRVGYIYDAFLEVYDQDGHFVEEIYTYDYDRCWYFYHKEDRGYPYEPDESVPDENITPDDNG